MSNYKEFQGKNLDDAIREACEYYGVAREKLEIEILSDAKSGIFGLVGAKKAVIRATRVELGDTVSTLLAEQKEKPAQGTAGKRRQERDAPPSPGPGAARSSGAENSREAAGREHTARPAAKERVVLLHNQAPRRPGRAKSFTDPPPPAPVKPEAGGRPLSGEAALPPPVEAAGGSRRKEAAAKGRKSAASRSEASGQGDPGARGTALAPVQKEASARKETPAHIGSDVAPARPSSLSDSAAAFEEEALDFSLDSGRDDLPDFVLEGCDQDQVFAVVRDVVLNLVKPIVGPVPCQVEIAGRRVRVILDCGDASGLLVGRDGQTLAAVQYLAARIVSRQLGGSVRLQIDAGNYRERQDDKLRDLALSLAERAKQSGRSQSTRPLCAYQRRIVHLALEHDPAILTRSKGEGAQRKVVIYLNRDAAGNEGKTTHFPLGDARQEEQPVVRDMSDPYRLLVPGAVERTASLGSGAAPFSSAGHAAAPEEARGKEETPAFPGTELAGTELPETVAPETAAPDKGHLKHNGEGLSPEESP